MRTNLCSNLHHGAVIASYDVKREITPEEKCEIQNYLDSILEEEDFDADAFSDYFFEILNQKGLISYDNKTVADFYI